jgi:hypothetical protein
MTVLLKPWLRRQPQPVAVLCDDKRVPVPRGNKAWSELARTVEALNPAQVQCLAADGTVIRAMMLATPEGEDAAAPSDDDTSETAALKTFARLVAEAYDKSSKASAPLLAQAMDFVERQGQRLARTELELERAYAHIHKLQAELLEATAITTEDGEQTLLGALMQGAVAGEAAKAKLAKGNGATQKGKPT